MANTSVFINGVMYSWQNASINLFGAPIVGITKIDLKQSQAKDNLYGVGNEVIGQGYGNKSYEGSITVYAEELFNWIDAVSSGDLTDIPPFDFAMALVSQKGLPRTLKVTGAGFKDVNFQTSQGDTKITIDIPLIVAKIYWK